jgi:hypothetical protein
MISTETTISAVNRVLGSIGDSPVNSIENPGNVNVINAIKELEEVNRQEQSKGWSFNSTDSYTLNTDITTKRINWSSTYLRLKSQNGDILTHKGNYVYNFTKQTYTFTTDQTVSAIILVDMEEMPEAMKDYIIAKASFQFQMKYLGDPDLSRGLKTKLDEAWMELQNYEMEMNGYNILNNPDVTKIVGG